MKNLLLFILICAFNNQSFAQDLIVTNDGDSIHCKITKIKGGNIYFAFRYENENRKTLLPKSKVSDYTKNFFKTSEVESAKEKANEDFRRFRFAVNSGFSYQTAKINEDIPDDFKSYIKNLKSGFHIGGKLSYFFNEVYGFGLKYTLFKTSNSIDNIYLEDTNGIRTYGQMSDNILINFIGPVFSTRIFNRSNRNAFIADISVGYAHYQNNKILIDKFQITGGTIALGIDLGYDVSLSHQLKLGFQVGLLSGSLSKYHLNNGRRVQLIKLEKGEYESLNRLDFSLGLRFEL